MCSNWCFDGAEFASADELSALFLAFTSPRCTLRSFELQRITISSDTHRSSTKHIIRDFLLAANHPTLESLFIRMPDLCSQEDLVPFLTRSASSLKELTIDICGTSLDEVHQILAALAHNTISPSYLSVRSYGTRQSLLSSVESGNELGMMLRTNTSLDHLHLGCLFIPGKVVEMLFTSLEKNEHLTGLSLYSCSGDGWPSNAFVLDCLRSNGILSFLNLKKSQISYMRSDPAITAQLERNGENAKQVKELKAQQMNKRVAPTSIRLFLCGLPYSGKTTLSESLIKWNSTSSSIMSCFSCTKSRVLERTRGIQLTALERDGVRMSLWDLAGEREYHAFHDFMFPNFSNEAIPSMFLFVWNPIKVNDATGQEIIHPVDGPSTKGREVFEDEFKYWLKFIASKSLNSVKFKPILFVAITRADLLHFDAKNLIKKNFNQYQEEFKAHVEFDMEGVFSMDARDSESVHDLATHMLKVAKQVLGRASLTYQASNLLRSVLADTKSTAPLMKKEQLFLLCKKNLGINAKHIQESMALSLNDSGDIIYFNSCDLVVIDTQWFCHDIMGELIFYSSNNTHLKGHFQRQVLEDLLESKVGSTTRSKSPKCIRHVFAKPSKPWKIEGETLVNLLIALRLAFQEDESSDVFIPACLSHESRGQIRPSSYFTGAAKEKMSTCIGRRLKCHDSVCTFFTPGIFSFLQMSLERIFCTSKVTLEGNVIALAYEGFQVFIEACGKQGEEQFIDVLIRSPEDLDFTLQWLHDTILDKVENICANPKGIQGVQLAYEVIQPVHVKDDYVSEERTHTVSVEELKGILGKHLEKNGNCKKVRYSWPQTGDWEFVHALLGIQETLHVAESHIHSLSAAAEDALDMSMERRKDGAIESEALEDANCSNVDQQAGCSSMPMDHPVFKSTQSGKGMETMYLEVQNIRKKVDTLSNTADTINKKVDTINNKIDILNQKVDNIDNEIKSLRNEVVERVHKLLTFVEEGEAGKLPRMYVVTRGDGRLMHKMAAAVVPGLRSMRLGLLCEFKSKPHAVNGQPGLSLATLDNGLFRHVLPYVNAFLKVAQLAVKVGAHVAAGVGDSIPDFTHVLALIGDADAVPDFPTNISETILDEPSSTSSVPRVKYQEGQQWLYLVLSKHDCLTAIRIQEVFGLNRYRCRKSGVVAWLCDEHKSEGDHSPM